MRSIGRRLRPVALLVVGLFVGNAAAEQGCADGFMPNAVVSGTLGQNQCVPIPGSYRSGRENSFSGPQERWEARWGAIAMDNDSGKTGVAGDKSSRREAEQAA